MDIYLFKLVSILNPSTLFYVKNNSGLTTAKQKTVLL
jgi:hypothetical protein